MKTKTIRLVLVTSLLSLTGLATPPSTPVMFPVQSFFFNVIYGKQITVAAVHPWLTDGTNIYAGSSVSFAPTGGTNPIILLTPNDYTFQTPDSRVPLHFTIYPTDGTNLVNVVTRITNGLMSWWPLRFGGGGSGTVTNLASSALTIFTNQTVITNNGWTITLAAPASWYFEAIYFENSNLVATVGGNVFGGSNSLVTLNLTTNEVRDGWINLRYQAGASQMNIDVPFVGVGLTGSANYSTAVPWVNYTQVNAAIAGGTFYLACTASNSVSYVTNLVTHYNLTTFTNGAYVTNVFQ